MSHFVFLPGVNNDAGVWHPVMDALGPDHTSQAFDLPAVDSAEGIANAIAEQVPAGSVVVGHSFGGVVAQALLELHPDRVSELFLVNVPLRSDPPERVGERLERLASIATEEDYRAMAMGNLDRVYHADNAARPELVADRERSIAVYGHERFRAHSKALATRVDRTEVVKEADVPVVVIAADADVVVPTAAQHAWALEVGAGYDEIPKTGHMLPAEQPEVLARVLTTDL